MTADYVMVGGFLGAGKTTALLRLAEHFTSQDRRVGLITNDQSQGLVDTTLVQAKGYPVEEITGGCFCCRFNSLVDASDKLTAAQRPDVFIAENLSTTAVCVHNAAYEREHSCRAGSGHSSHPDQPP